MDENDDSQKTEDPTQKKLDEALKRGDVVKSQEVNTWFIIAGGTLALTAFSSTVSFNLAGTLRGLIENSYQIRVDGIALVQLGETLSGSVLAAVAIPFLLVVLAALGGNLIQHRLVWSVEALMPKISRISPASGLKRLFSVQALANSAKSILKLVLMGTVLTVLMWPDRTKIQNLAWTDLAAVLPLTRTLAVKMLGAVVAMLAVVAAADYLFQYWQWYEKQKMSLQEVKDEFKQSEGDPTIRGKMKQVRQNRMRKRMIAAAWKRRSASPRASMRWP